jgi:hypothetical protein
MKPGSLSAVLPVTPALFLALWWVPTTCPINFRQSALDRRLRGGTNSNSFFSGAYLGDPLGSLALRLFCLSFLFVSVLILILRFHVGKNKKKINFRNLSSIRKPLMRVRMCAIPLFNIRFDYFLFFPKPYRSIVRNTKTI